MAEHGRTHGHGRFLTLGIPPLASAGLGAAVLGLTQTLAEEHQQLPCEVGVFVNNRTLIFSRRPALSMGRIWTTLSARSQAPVTSDGHTLTKGRQVMSSETTDVDADSADILPRDVLQNSPNSLTDWALQINERERGLDQQRKASPEGAKAARRQALARHFGRHREEA